MNKAQLLADIEAKANGEILSTEKVETVGNVNRYLTNVFTAGEDQDSGPIAQKRTVNWYVYDEGGAGEEAYYGDKTWYNPEEKNLHGSGLKQVDAIYNNTALRKRVNGVICKGIRANNDAVSKAFADTRLDVLNLFMAWVASNPTIQTNGGAASDSNLEYVVLTEAWSTIAGQLA